MSSNPRVCLLLLLCVTFIKTTMTLPTITIDEVSDGIKNPSSNEAKKVLEGLINDFMDLHYGKETPYTTGMQILPTDTTLEEVEGAAVNESNRKYKDVFKKIVETAKSGDLTPQAINDGSWDPKLCPVLVLIRPNE